MTEQEAAERANAAAQQAGHDLTNYQAPRATFDATRWLVGYEEASDLPGKWFLVTVDDQTAVTDVHGGY